MVSNKSYLAATKANQALFRAIFSTESPTISSYSFTSLSNEFSYTLVY
jgi:hypothetical protein